jgi:hypothetical protein
MEGEGEPSGIKWRVSVKRRRHMRWGDEGFV